MTTDTKEKPLKIVSLQVEGIKRLVAVRIDPKGNLVQITGKNGQGKTSVLDSIWWALAGAGNVQSAPIRKGQNRATIRLDLGEVVVTRTFTKREEGEQPGTTITVENAEGARFPSPQRMLDSLLGSLSFDPLAFARMKPREQFDTLKAFVPGVDFENLEGLNRADFSKRSTVNAEVKSKKALAAAIQIPEATPPARVDENAIVDEISEVASFNAEIEKRKERRVTAAADAATKRKTAEEHRANAASLRNNADAADAKAEALDAEALELETKLKEAPPLDEPRDPEAIRARLEEAKRTNAAVEQATRRATLLAEVEALEQQADELTTRMEGREVTKRDAIAAAKLPVEGLGFGEDAITLNGLPFDQASDGEQLRASCAIAMASNPRLRVIRVRDGSLLDEEALALLGKMAEDGDYQVWIERVDSSGKVGFVLEDGHVRATPDAPADTSTQQAAE